MCVCVHMYMYVCTYVYENLTDKFPDQYCKLGIISTVLIFEISSLNGAYICRVPLYLCVLSFAIQRVILKSHT